MSDLKTVWIITRFANYNFGSTLQAYALQRAVQKLGFNGQIINYDEVTFKAKIRFFVLNSLAVVMRKFPVLFKSIFPLQYARLVDFRIQRLGFNKFESSHFNLTPQKYRSSKSISLHLQGVFACICGSDQIWNPEKFDPTFYLDFVKNKHTRKIAYAPSVGVSSLEACKEENRAVIRSLVNDIDYLSVREEQGAKYLKELTGRDAFVVLDPTLLIDRKEWETVLEYPNFIRKPYILSYFLSERNMPYKFIEQIQKATGLNVINLFTNYSHNPLRNAWNIGSISPSEFLGLVAGAEYVCTNSFHGTIFSIMFSRRFFVFPRHHSGLEKRTKFSQNSRIVNLLKSLSLEDRFMEADSTFDVSDHPINYSIAYQRLLEKKQESLAFLRNALSST
jgi:hypothetical protein